VRQLVDPAAPPKARWWLALGLGVILALGFRATDALRERQNSRHYGSLVARQIASAAEGLVLAAQQKNISEPAQWAITYLAQGVEPRMIQISKLGGSPLESLETSQDGQVDYQKPFILTGKDAGTGIRVSVRVPASGFLGTTSRLGADFATLLLAGTLTLLMGFFFSIRSQAHALRVLTDEKLGLLELQSEQALRRDRVASILPEMREVMLATGRQLRDIFSRFEEVGRSTTHAQSNVQRARQSHHHAIQQVRKVMRAIDDLSGHCLHAEASTLNVMVQSSRQDARSSMLSARLAQQQMSEIRRKQDQIQAILHELERRLEPTAMDLDLSFHSLEETQEELRQVPEQMQEAGNRMMSQGRAFQTFDQEFESAASTK